jgi:hypothetical protein
MELSEFLELLFVLLTASVKFAVAVTYMLARNSEYDYFDILIRLIVGGFIGVLFFYYFSNFINRFLSKLFKKKKKKNIFSKKVRRFISIKNKYGLIGISLLTPIIISIPVGCFIASRFFQKKKITIFVMLFGVIFWSVLLPLLSYLVDYFTQGSSY